MFTSANKLLRHIANDRYTLDYETEGTNSIEIILKGKWSGGISRKSNTLSGGEKFLVSLSLALALSKLVQSGTDSVECFFLDEGFGALDPRTLETVFEALERLRTEERMIGVISHVTEVEADGRRLYRGFATYTCWTGLANTNGCELRSDRKRFAPHRHSRILHRLVLQPP
ncbi:MAG: SbcC/MukB-like Walker B domain-containing protein [Planctomycetota bacterium]|nr:SbcC/MukB-like Walker B domain-containing protein [Planctomycetota bacterium]